MRYTVGNEKVEKAEGGRAKRARTRARWHSPALSPFQVAGLGRNGSKGSSKACVSAARACPCIQLA